MKYKIIPFVTVLVAASNSPGQAAASQASTPAVPGPCFREIAAGAFAEREKLTQNVQSFDSFLVSTVRTQKFYLDGSADWVSFGRGIVFQFGKKTQLVNGFSLRAVIHLPNGKPDVTRYYHTVEENLKNGRLNILLHFGLDLGAVTGVDLAAIMDDLKICPTKLAGKYTWPHS